MRRQIVDTRFGQVHVRTSEGAGVPPLLLLHMSPISGGMHESLMAALEGNRPTLAPDRLGFGSSDPPPHALSMEEFALSTLDVLDALGHRVVDVLGTHTGAVEAVALAHLAPGRIRRVGLVAVPLFSAQEIEKLRALVASPPPAPDEAGAYLVEIWRKRFLFRQPPYHLAILHWRLVEELKAGANKTIAYEAVFAYPLAERLRALRHPLVVLAPHDDLTEQTLRARPLLPAGSVYVDLPDLGLDLFALATERMAGLVRECLPLEEEGNEQPAPDSL